MIVSVCAIRDGVQVMKFDLRERARESERERECVCERESECVCERERMVKVCAIRIASR
jgi:hypothetical protein